MLDVPRDPQGREPKRRYGIFQETLIDIERLMLPVPRVTIAIPFFSKTDLLLKAIGSVRAQTLDAWQLIVCDDAGPEPEAQAAVDALGDPRIRYLRNPENLGLAGNWNRCLALAGTELVVLLHADDEIEPDYVEKMLAFADQDPSASAYFCLATVIDRAGDEIFSFPDFYKNYLIPKPSKGVISLVGERGLGALMKGNFVFCPSILYRRSRCPDSPFRTDLRCVPDWEFTTSLLLRNEKLLGLPQALYRYRRHGTSVTDETRRNLRMFEEELRLRLSVADRAAARGWNEASKSARRMTGLLLAICHFSLTDLLRLDFGGLRTKVQMMMSIVSLSGR